MQNKPDNKKIQCTKCGSNKARPTGNGYVTGVGQPMKQPERLLYKCGDCGVCFFPKPEKSGKVQPIVT